MEQETKINGGTGERRKSFLEKLGLIETVDKPDEGTVPSSPEAISSLFAGDSKEAKFIAETPILEPMDLVLEEEVPMPANTSVAFDPVPVVEERFVDIEPQISAAEAFLSPADAVAPATAFEASQPAFQQAVASEKNIEALTVSEIYTLFNLKPTSDRDTIYLVENFLQALPINLPFEVKKDSLAKLLTVSSFGVTELVEDGARRIDTLKKYLDDFTRDLEDVIAYNKAQAAELKAKMEHHQQLITEKSNMIKEQRGLVQFETQRILTLLDSVGKGR